MASKDTLPSLNAYVMNDVEDVSMYYPPNELTVGQTNYSQADEFLIFPNPTKDNLTLALTGSNYGGDAVLEVFNMQGSLLLSKVFNGNITTIDATKFAEGTYLVRLVAEGESYTKTFVKQ